MPISTKSDNERASSNQCRSSAADRSHRGGQTSARAELRNDRLYNVIKYNIIYYNII